MTKEEKVNRISIGMILNCLLAIIWLVIEIIDYADTGEKIQVGTIMWVCLSIYILIKKIGGKYSRFISIFIELIENKSKVGNYFVEYPTYFFKKQEQIDNLQQAFNETEKDLKELKKMKKYQKIDNVFRFDEKYRNILGLNEPFKTLKDIQWEGTEKVDGTNIRIYWNGYEISFAGRTEKSVIPQHLLEYLIKTFKTKEMEYVFEQMFGEKEVYLFGEGCGPKIQTNGELYFDEPTFVLFDVNIDSYDLDRQNVNEIALKLGINAVPVLFRGTLEEAINWVSTPSLSFVGKGNREIEGLVLVPANGLQLYDKHGKLIKCKCKYGDIRKDTSILSKCKGCKENDNNK